MRPTVAPTKSVNGRTYKIAKYQTGLIDSVFEKTEYAYVLSNKIPEHSVVEITNPMSNKKITGKVIGKIPPGKYPLDILLLLAKNDASDLGFLDLKFFVSVKYYK